MKDKDIDVMLAHMKHKNLLALSDITINGQKTNLIKLNTYLTKEMIIITEKEKATFVLQ
jgi:hypothetical protein